MFLHQTTTPPHFLTCNEVLFIILFLHQTTTKVSLSLYNSSLFIILFLHQTTTIHGRVCAPLGCLSSCSYIKPQHSINVFLSSVVVYHLVPTSNHNYSWPRMRPPGLFIILFLHQTTTLNKRFFVERSCLSSCSYIKPQPVHFIYGLALCCLSSCSYIKPQPSAVLSLFPISCLSSCSYIKPQLTRRYRSICSGCLSSCSYIKPQRRRRRYRRYRVVYHLVPTSNHNLC